MTNPVQNSFPPLLPDIVIPPVLPSQIRPSQIAPIQGLGLSAPSNLLPGPTTSALGTSPSAVGDLINGGLFTDVLTSNNIFGALPQPTDVLGALLLVTDLVETALPLVTDVLDTALPLDTNALDNVLPLRTDNLNPSIEVLDTAWPLVTEIPDNTLPSAGVSLELSAGVDVGVSLPPLPTGLAALSTDTLANPGLVSDILGALPTDNSPTEVLNNGPVAIPTNTTPNDVLQTLLPAVTEPATLPILSDVPDLVVPSEVFTDALGGVHFFSDLLNDDLPLDIASTDVLGAVQTATSDALNNILPTNLPALPIQTTIGDLLDSGVPVTDIFHALPADLAALPMGILGALPADILGPVVSAGGLLDNDAFADAFSTDVPGAVATDFFTDVSGAVRPVSEMLNGGGLAADVLAPIATNITSAAPAIIANVLSSGLLAELALSPTLPTTPDLPTGNPPLPTATMIAALPPLPSTLATLTLPSPSPGALQTGDPVLPALPSLSALPTLPAPPTNLSLQLTASFAILASGRVSTTYTYSFFDNGLVQIATVFLSPVTGPWTGTLLDGTSVGLDVEGLYIGGRIRVGYPAAYKRILQEGTGWYLPLRQVRGS
ncbi:hypothetical protein B5807_08736 [Epicoccum nigrum]|uniref:Uncharacterized protein n=1 Tax=Epicoccum nigrum TaxID=105696 RepID=A0A1Y2LSX4_EPING|nr:hypothetical protein B5807_08736 [Epicoccum nigrum]